MYFRHTLRLANAVLRPGKDLELLPLPEAAHMVQGSVVMKRLWSGVALHCRGHLARPAER